MSTLTITVVFSPAARQVTEWSLVLFSPATIAQTLDSFPALTFVWHQAVGEGKPLADASVGIWGKQALATALLQDGDRLEIYRPLAVDPKVARRERFQTQGRRRAGLFVKSKNAHDNP
jgi:putative ubiquitin-RnfH superfamily antitoxin RatB of RatAB toxin-antitoxin module